MEYLYQLPILNNMLTSCIKNTNLFKFENLVIIKINIWNESYSQMLQFTFYLSIFTFVDTWDHLVFILLLFISPTRVGHQQNKNVRYRYPFQYSLMMWSNLKFIRRLILFIHFKRKISILHIICLHLST